MAVEELASYQHCTARICETWPAFLEKRRERLKQQERLHPVAEGRPVRSVGIKVRKRKRPVWHHLAVVICQAEPTAGREPAPEWREPALSGASSCYQWRLER